MSVALIGGVAAASTAVMIGWSVLMRDRETGHATINSMRQQAGVLAAIVNCVGAVLDALMLVKRIRANTSGIGGLSFGTRAGNLVEDV